MSLVSKINIRIKGKNLKDFEHVSINESIYGIDSFDITCRYDTVEQIDGFLIENAKDFLGSPIIIQLKVKSGNSEKDGYLFNGYVTEIQSSRTGMADNDKIVISGGSMEVLMNGKPTNRAFMDKTLDEIVNEVLKSYTEFDKKIKTRDKFRYPYIVQYEESDLDFLKRLSIRYGEWFFFSGKVMFFGELPKNDQRLTIGQNLDDFRYGLRVDPVSFSILSVDPLKPDVYNYKSGSGKAIPNLDRYGKHALDVSKKIFKKEAILYNEHVNVNETEFRKAIDMAGEKDEISDAIKLSYISGSSTNAFLTSGMFIKVNCPKDKGSQTIDYGRFLITSIHHSFDNLLSYNNSFTAVPDNASIPENTDPYFVKTSSNQLGIVADNKDPKKLGRIRINFWWMANDSTMTPWVKLITPYTQANSGIYFIPAVKSRVLVGFEGGDVEKPYCLGTLFDETQSPDPSWSGDYNNTDAKVHAMRTASGQTIELHDESGKEKIRIYDTGNKNEITLDTANKEIIIKSEGKLSLIAKDIEIKASGNIKIEADQTLEQKGMHIKSEAKADMASKSPKVEIKADISLKVEGTTSAELSSPGITTIKGSMVKLN
jgi:type VI secretion system secreted protein VgrG